MSNFTRSLVGLGAGALGALATGVVVERRVSRTRRDSGAMVELLGALHSDPAQVTTDDGVALHCEIDEVAPYAAGTRRDPDRPVVVFVHGYALNLNCWHYQRDALRGKHRMLFYDQRSHGRSGRSPREHATIDRLGDDLAEVLDELLPGQPVVLVGHSMGGMSIMAFAERHRATYDERVRGVGLISTTAGGLHPHRTVGPWIPDLVGDMVAPRLITALANAPELVDTARRRGSNIGYLIADRFAFGGDVPAAQVEFLNEMLAATPYEVLAEFFPHFGSLDKYAVLEAFASVPTSIVCGTKDRLTPIGFSRKMAAQIPGSRLVECPGAGHMVVFENALKVNAALEQLITQATAEGGPR